jgi:CobQ-like glutamine amidotransferase family enzyme
MGMEEHRELRMVWLYPDIMNLHGDRGNMMALSHIAAAMHLPLQIIRANRAEEIPDLEQVDCIYIGAGQMRNMKPVTDDLRSKAAALQAYAEQNGHMLVIGSSGCILSKSFVQYDGSQTAGLGILDMTAKELNRTKMPYVTNEVYGDDILFKTIDGMEIVGCQIQRLDFTLHDVPPFGTVLYGYGNNTTDGTEGARYKNVIFTNTVGPLFCCNPWFGVELLSDIAAKKGYPVTDFEESRIAYLAYAKESLQLKKKFIKEKFKLPGIRSKL